MTNHEQRGFNLASIALDHKKTLCYETVIKNIPNLIVYYKKVKVTSSFVGSPSLVVRTHGRSGPLGSGPASKRRTRPSVVTPEFRRPPSDPLIPATVD